MAVKFADISNAEMVVLRALWEQGPGTVREVGGRLRGPQRRWAYTTIQTLLIRLEAKGCVRADRTGQPHVFRAAITRERLLSRRLRELADEVCDGTATPLVMALVKGRRFSSEELEGFRKLIEDIDPERSGTARKGRDKREEET